MIWLWQTGAKALPISQLTGASAVPVLELLYLLKQNPICTQVFTYSLMLFGGVLATRMCVHVFVTLWMSIMHANCCNETSVAFHLVQFIREIKEGCWTMGGSGQGYVGCCFFWEYLLFSFSRMCFSYIMIWKKIVLVYGMLCLACPWRVWWQKFAMCVGFMVFIHYVFGAVCEISENTFARSAARYSTIIRTGRVAGGAGSYEDTTDDCSD